MWTVFLARVIASMMCLEHYTTKCGDFSGCEPLTKKLRNKENIQESNRNYNNNKRS